MHIYTYTHTHTNTYTYIYTYNHTDTNKHIYTYAKLFVIYFEIPHTHIPHQVATIQLNLSKS